MRLVPSILLAAVVAFIAPTASAQAIRVGVFDPAKVFSGSKLGQKLQDDLNQFFVGKQAELKKSQDDFEKRVQQYKAGVGTMSPEKKEEVETDLATRQRDLERTARDAESEFKRRQQKAFKDLGEEINTIVQDLGKRNGYTLILDRQSVIFASDTIDVSDEIVRLLDAKRTQ